VAGDVSGGDPLPGDTCVKCVCGCVWTHRFVGLFVFYVGVCGCLKCESGFGCGGV